MTLSRRNKLLIALHDKDSLLKYIANIPMQLMPEVLELGRPTKSDEYAVLFDEMVEHAHTLFLHSYLFLVN
jgi:hypothetical protein